MSQSITFTSGNPHTASLHAGKAEMIMNHDHDDADDENHCYWPSGNNDDDDLGNFCLVLRRSSVLRQNQTNIRKSITTISQRRKYNRQLMPDVLLYQIRIDQIMALNKIKTFIIYHLVFVIYGNSVSSGV